MASNPVFVATPKFRTTIVNNANAGDPAYQNPTTIATLLTMGANGGRIDNVYITPAGTNGATALRFFVDIVGSGGTNNLLVRDESVAAATSITTSALTQVVWQANMVLPAGAVLRATVANTAVTNGIAVAVEYGEF